MKTNTILKNGANMKSQISKGKIIAFMCAVLCIAFISCNSNIDGEDVNIDETTAIYTYKKNGNLVTGTVVFYKLDSETGKKYKEAVREVNEGKRINTGYDYYPSGNIFGEIQFNENGLITGEAKLYFENGKLVATIEYKENKKMGLKKNIT